MSDSGRKDPPGGGGEPTWERVMVFVWGGRGEVQPALALAQRLRACGKEICMFVTPPMDKEVISHGFACYSASESHANYAQQVFGRIDLSNRGLWGLWEMSSVAQAYLKSPGYQELQQSDMKIAWEACQAFNPEVLLICGYMYNSFFSFAEKLGVPVVQYDLQCNAPHLGLCSPGIDFLSLQPWAALQTALWRMWRGPMAEHNKLRQEQAREHLRLPHTMYSNGTKLVAWPHSLPEIIALPAALVTAPVDWKPEKYLSGYWFLPEDPAWLPSKELEAFMDCSWPICVSFGGLLGNNSFRLKLATVVFQALERVKAKAVMLRGEVGLSVDFLDTSTPEGLATAGYARANVLEMDECPHGWLLPRCSAIIHHGGAGTTSAALSAGIPSIVCAAYGDQTWMGRAVSSSGAGIYAGAVGSVSSAQLAEHIKATENVDVRTRAKSVSSRIKHDEGTVNAVKFIEECASSFPYPWRIASPWHSPDRSRWRGL